MNPMFYFLLAFAAVLAATANAGGPIFDTNGEVMFVGYRYFVVPRVWGTAAGGLTLAPRGKNQCPLFIGQEPSEISGIPVRFTGWRAKGVFVPESTNLNIMMDVKATTCVQSTYWWVTAAESHSTTMFITAGRRPKSGEDSADSIFQIKKIEDNIGGYKIVFCPEGKDCINVGIKVDQSGVRRLVLSSTPFKVVFDRDTSTDILP